MDPIPEPSPPPTAASLLALAERVVHWEDDVSSHELRYYAALYAQAEHQARSELAQLSGGATEQAAPTPVWEAGTSLALMRSELLAQRARASALVAQLERARSARLERPAYAYSLLALTLLLVAASGVYAAYRPALEWFDLGNVSKKKPWRASSGANASMPLHGTLDPPLGAYFFFTATEREPWIEIDLQRQTTIRSAVVRNRDDCCKERAVPLVLEISVDRKHWNALAEQRTPFAVWRPRFASTPARWVRLRVQAESSLHLHSVIVRSL